jgi:hypothetical protein
VTPEGREGYKIDRAAGFLMNFLTVSFIDAVWSVSSDSQFPSMCTYFHEESRKTQIDPVM